MMYKSAIIGVGAFAHTHAKAYEYTDLGKLVACCNTSGGNKLKDFANQYGINGYSSAREMIEKERPDIVHIVTLPNVRVEIMKLVDELGVKGCIVEKPIAWEARDYNQLVVFSENSTTKFVVSMQFRHHPLMMKCRKAIDDGILGKVKLVDVSCGMNICNQGVHILDWAMAMAGDSPVKEVFGNVSGYDFEDKTHPGPAVSTARITLENGATILWNTGHTSTKVNANDPIYAHCRAQAYCENGSALFEEFGQSRIFSKEGEEIYHSTEETRASNNRIAQSIVMDTLYEWIQGGKPAETRLTQALHQWNAVLGLYASAEAKKPIKIPFNPENDLVENLFEKLKKQSNR